jgi:NAD(P)-dependent dehydrogenase (short-subunit alcohol dehydrogenase family)
VTVESLTLDLADLRSIDRFASDLRSRTDRIDIMVGGGAL